VRDAFCDPLFAVVALVAGHAFEYYGADA
jgi:hypothetical protein